MIRDAVIINTDDTFVRVDINPDVLRDEQYRELVGGSFECVSMDSSSSGLLIAVLAAAREEQTDKTRNDLASGLAGVEVFGTALVLKRHGDQYRPFNAKHCGRIIKAIETVTAIDWSE